MRARSKRVRPAFTLIELIVVISIIAILLLLSSGAAMRFMGGAMTSATRTTLDRLSVRLNGQMAALRDKASKEVIPDAITALAGGDPDRARVIYIKLRMKQSFPNSFYEALNPAPLPPLRAYVVALAKVGINSGNASPIPAAHESSACLYMALRYGPDGTSEDELGVGSAFGSVGGVPVLIDSWGTPLVFCRWPTGDAAGRSIVHPGGYLSGYHDPGDPRGTLNDSTWGGAATFMTLCHPLQAGATLNLTATILSAGPDKQAGVNPLTLASLGAASNDNIIAGRIK